MDTFSLQKDHCWNDHWCIKEINVEYEDANLPLASSLMAPMIQSPEKQPSSSYPKYWALKKSLWQEKIKTYISSS